MFGKCCCCRSVPKTRKKMAKKAEEAELERLARDELLREANNARRRTDTLGAVGWQKCPLPSTNKRFLRNMLLGTKSREETRRNRPDINKRHKHHLEHSKEKFDKHPRRVDYNKERAFSDKHEFHRHRSAEKRERKHKLNSSGINSMLQLGDEFHSSSNVVSYKRYCESKEVTPEHKHRKKK